MTRRGNPKRTSITIYLDRKIWNELEKLIKPSGGYPSGMLEAIIRVAVNPRAAHI